MPNKIEKFSVQLPAVISQAGISSADTLLTTPPTGYSTHPLFVELPAEAVRGEEQYKHIRDDQPLRRHKSDQNQFEPIIQPANKQAFVGGNPKQTIQSQDKCGSDSKPQTGSMNLTRIGDIGERF